MPDCCLPSFVRQAAALTVAAELVLWLSLPLPVLLPLLLLLPVLVLSGDLKQPLA
jgi:hypothetical protein